MVNKLKPNVLLVAGAVAGLTLAFGYWLFNNLGDTVSNEILALLIGIGVGGLATLAGTLAAPEPKDPYNPTPDFLAYLTARDEQDAEMFEAELRAGKDAD